MKKLVSLFLCLILVCSTSVCVYGDSIISKHIRNDDIKVVLKNYSNGYGILVTEKEVKFDVPPQIIDDRTMVPIRAVAEELGWKVDWLEDDGIVLLKGVFTRGKTSGDNYGQKRPLQANSLLNLYSRLHGDLVVNENTGDTHIGSLANWGYLGLNRGIMIDGELEDYLDKSANTVSAEIAIDTQMVGPHPYLELVFCDYDDYWYGITGSRVNWKLSNAGGEIYTYGMDVGATIIDGRTLLPLRAITESMGATVDWVDETRTVVIDFGAKD